MIAKTATLAVAALLAAGALAGCGGGSSATGTKPGDGKQIFTDSCGGCHAFKAADTGGGSGPDLSNLRIGSAKVAQQVKNGGGGMPSFDGTLDATQIAAVSKFVAENDGSGE